MTNNLISIVISIAAIGLSLSVFLYGRWRDKRDLLLKIHEHLVSVDQHRGRRLLYAMKENQTRVQDLSENDYILINNALAALNVLGIYYQRRYVRRKDVLDLWAVALLRSYMAGEAFIAHRNANHQMNMWPYLRVLAGDAQKYVERTQLSIQVPGQSTAALLPVAEKQDQGG